MRHLSNVASLARAYRSPQSKLQGDETVRSAVLNSLEYWLSHDFQNPNWWWNQIGVPRSLLPVLLLMDKDLSNEQRSRAFTILRRAKIGMTGQNLVWVTEITAVRGILENDPKLVAAAYRRDPARHQRRQHGRRPDDRPLWFFVRHRSVEAWR